MMSNKSQFILDYPMKEIPPSQMKYNYKKESIDEYLNNKIVRSKKQYKFEDNFESEGETRVRRFGELALKQNQQFQKYVETVDPKDSDFNYNRIQVLSHTHAYDVIDEEIEKFNKTIEIMKVFTKHNEHVNFFLNDFQGIVDNKEEYNMKLKKQANTQKENSQIDNGYKAIALKDAFSQGKCFFSIEITQTYDVVREYDDGIYLELRNLKNREQIGIFLKSDLQKLQSFNHQQQNYNSQQTENELKQRDHKGEMQDDKQDNSMRNSGQEMNQASTQNRKKSLISKSPIPQIPAKGNLVNSNQSKFNQSVLLSTNAPQKRFS